MPSLFKTVSFLIVAASACVCQAQSVQQDVYLAREIWTGESVIQEGGMVVVNGVIQTIGPRKELASTYSSDARVHDLGNQVIIPGLVAAQSSLSGANAEVKTLTPQNRSIDGFDFFADRSKLLAAGVTSAEVSPNLQRLMPGSSSLVSLGGDLADRVLNETSSLVVVLSAGSRTPPRIYEPPVGPVAEDRPLEPTRPQVAKLATSMAVLREVFRQANAGESQDEIVQQVAELLADGTPIRISASTSSEIRGALSLAEEHDFPLILVDCQGLKSFVGQFESWKGRVRGVVLAGPSPGQITNPAADSLKDRKEPWEYARHLLDAGIPVAIRTANDADLTETMFVAGQFMRGDLNAGEVLAAVTSVPAQLSGSNRIGTLTEGKRADFVVLTDAPFKMHTRVSQTVVAGDAVYTAERKNSTMIIRGGKVYLGDGHYADDASVVVKGQTVRSVGSSVSAPGNAEVRDFGDAYIVPGFVDMGSTMGLGGPLTGSIPLSTKLGEQLYADDPAIQYARSQGITTALLRASGGSATPVVAFKLGDDTRVLGDPVAIRFAFSSDTDAGRKANERLLKAGKAYSDAWTKYEKDLAEYNVKKAEADKKAAAEAAKKKAEAKKEADKKETEKKPADKKEADKKEGEGKTPPKEGEKDKPVEKDKPEVKDKPVEKEKDEKTPPKKKPKPDPITGTWEGTVESERIPPQARSISMELELDEEGNEVVGSLSAFRQQLEIENGAYDRETRALSFSFSIQNNEVPISGTLDAEGTFKGTIKFGRLGEAPIVAKRTVDKSRKPEEDDEEKDEEKDEPKPDEKKDKPGEKPAEKDKPQEKGDKPAEKPKTGDEKKPAETKSEDKKPEEKKPEELKPPKKPNLSTALEPYRALFAGKIPAVVDASNLYSIEAAAKLFSKEYKLRTIIVGANDLARQSNLLEEYDISVIAGPGFNVTIDKQPPVSMPQLLATEGLTFGFQSNGTTGSGKLPQAVQFAIRQGLSSTDALNGLTQNPAKMLSSEMSFGQLKAGMDADLVVLSGPPFEFSTKVLAVMIDGVWVYEREEAK